MRARVAEAMNFFRSALPLLLASLSLGASVFACSAPTDDDDSASDESDIKKKVSPKGGNGEFDLLAPTSFKTDGYSGSFTFAGPSIAMGDKVQKVPGAYSLTAQGVSFVDGVLPSSSLPFTITAGAIVKNQLAGLNIHFSEPLTLGSARVDMIETGGGNAYLDGNKAWQTKATGSAILLLAGTISVTPSTEGTATSYTIAENTLKEIVLPVAHVTVSLDAVDPAYPSPASCAIPTITGGAYNYPYNYMASAPLRKSDGTPSATYVVPSGSKAPVTLTAYGLGTQQATTAGGTNSFTLNRLEVDDVEVAQTGGGSTFVKGSVYVVKKNANGTTTALNCTFPTHSGIDLPDGDYTVTSSASTASGTVTSSQDVSFP